MRTLLAITAIVGFAIATSACAQSPGGSGRGASPGPGTPVAEGGRVSIQNGVFEGALPEHMHRDIWTVGGNAVAAGKGRDLAWFLEQDERAIRRQLTRYQSRSNLPSDYAGVLVLDIEHPVHPQDWGKFMAEARNPREFEALMHAVRIRVETARLMFPNAKLALYGIGMPDSRGDASNPAYVQSMEGYAAAGRLGVYDKLDFIVPVLYMRFGPSDRGYHTIDDYTRLGVESGRKIRKSNGQAIEIMPFLGLVIANGRSAHHHQAADKADIAKQIKTLRELEVRYWAFWVGDGDPEQLHEPVSDIVREVMGRAN